MRKNLEISARVETVLECGIEKQEGEQDLVAERNLAIKNLMAAELVTLGLSEPTIKRLLNLERTNP